MWVKEQHQQTRVPIPKIAANAILTIISITCMLLKRQIDAQAKAFENEGGFTERLYKLRKQSRRY